MLLVGALDEPAAIAEVDDPHLGPSRESLGGIGSPHAQDNGQDTGFPYFGLALHAWSYGLCDDGFFEKEGFGRGGWSIPPRTKGMDGEIGHEGKDENDYDDVKKRHGKVSILRLGLARHLLFYFDEHSPAI